MKKHSSRPPSPSKQNISDTQHSSSASPFPQPSSPSQSSTTVFDPLFFTNNRIPSPGPEPRSSFESDTSESRRLKRKTKSLSLRTTTKQPVKQKPLPPTPTTENMSSPASTRAGNNSTKNDPISTRPLSQADTSTGGIGGRGYDNMNRDNDGKHGNHSLPMPGLSGKGNGPVGNLLRGPVDEKGQLTKAALMVGIKLDLEAEVHLTARVRGDILVGLY